MTCLIFHGEKATGPPGESCSFHVLVFWDYEVWNGIAETKVDVKFVIYDRGAVVSSRPRYSKLKK